MFSETNGQLDRRPNILDIEYKEHQNATIYLLSNGKCSPPRLDRITSHQKHLRNDYPNRSIDFQVFPIFRQLERNCLYINNANIASCVI